MMRRLLMTVAVLAFATLAAACDTGGIDTRTFQLDHMSPASAEALIGPYVTDSETNMKSSTQPAAITVSASSSRLDQIGEMLSRYDVATPDVRLRFQLIEADGFADVDPAIADVEAAVRELFRFDGYRLVAEALVTSTQQTQSRQRLLGFGNVPLTLTVFVDRISAVEQRRPPSPTASGSPAPGGDADDAAVSGGVRSADVAVILSGPEGDIFQTRVVVPDGQIVVLGTARPFEDRGALILVVRPEIQ